MRVQGKGEASRQRLLVKGPSFTPEYHIWGYLEHVHTFGIQTRSGNTGLTIVNTGKWIFEHGTGRIRRTEAEVLDRVFTRM